jgi:hypothetical protein
MGMLTSNILNFVFSIPCYITLYFKVKTIKFLNVSMLRRCLRLGLNKMLKCQVFYHEHNFLKYELYTLAINVHAIICELKIGVGRQNKSKV